MGFMTGKRVLIVGVASKLSIASGIAAAMHREGAELAFTYQNEKLQKRVKALLKPGAHPLTCASLAMLPMMTILTTYLLNWQKSGTA